MPLRETPDHSAALQFAHEQLGSASVAFLQSTAGSSVVSDWYRRGKDHRDAALAAVYSATADDRQLAGEFLNYFLSLLSAEHLTKDYPTIRPLDDTHDVLASVVKDLHADLFHLEFRGRVAFLGLLRQRAFWKMNDKKKRAHAFRRSENRRVDADISGAVGSSTMEPEVRLSIEEEKRQLVSLLRNLSSKERAILELYFQGETQAAIAERFQIASATVSRAVRRFGERRRRDA